MKNLLFLVCALVFIADSEAQDSLTHRIILIGDAGEINPGQQHVLQQAARQVISGKTTVLFLGDNIYPDGMGLPGSKKDERAKGILQSQYLPMRAKGAAVYFIPGNHDWDRSGADGLAKVKLQWQYLEQQRDTLLKLVPGDGCPDPVEINVSDSLTIIAFDSEWWLFPFDKKNVDADCECRTKPDIIAKLGEIYYRNRHKIILLASHHPFQSYGVHGGRFGLKDHIFPLANITKTLFPPLPVIGSLYPLLRSAFANPEDLKHPIYKQLIKQVTGVFDSFPNLIHVSGHEHGLQLIKNKRQMQIVSGSGAKHTTAKKIKHSLFAYNRQGFVVADLLPGNQIKMTFYANGKESAEEKFTYTKQYTPVRENNLETANNITGDSITVQTRASYDKPGKFHRLVFGENYRKEWAAPTTLPVIRISQIHGGLTPLQLGGGMQSKSLRLADKQGKEWVIRSVEKSPEALLPEGVKETFIKDWVDDVTSAQHPFSALIVPPLANAANIPHANPVIGVVAPDKNLGIYGRTFNGMIVLLEEREPLGKSDNSAKMKKNLQKDNDNQLQGKEFLKARMLDALIGDWDRHEDQWRWYDEGKGKDKLYLGVPRDRDQVFHLTQGLLPKLVSRDYILPTLRDFDASISKIKWLLFKTRMVNAYPSFQINKADWMKEAEDFKKSITDSVLEAALLRLPKASYQIRHDELLDKLKSRREKLPAAMENYYRFIQKIADIQTSDKDELVIINDAPGGGLQIRINKISKEGAVKDELMNKVYDPELTREIRIFVGNGNDSIVLNAKTSGIKIRVVGGDDKKAYQIINSKKKVSLYDKENGSSYAGNLSRLNKHVSNDSANTAFAPVNLYNIWMPIVKAGINIDDGFILAAGFKYIKQEGFRKFPYASSHKLVAGHSFSTKAFNIEYNGDWTQAAGNADLSLRALIKAPDNTMNFFGRGNETIFNKAGDHKRYYRSRFSIYQLDPALRWTRKKGAIFSIGPSLYYYRFNKDDNSGRFINQVPEIGSYDSATIDKEKWHVGIAARYTKDLRNNKILPQWGSYINIRLQAYKGLGQYTRSFAQLIPEIALYKSLDAKSGIVLAERLGGTFTLGKTAFYHSAFLGGQDNLLGYRQYRFAGQHAFYNNLELRIKLADLAGYIAPGQFGITGFWDIGRVWEKNEQSNKWHNGVGGGIYFAPASMFVVNFLAGYSREGWYPYVTMGIRF